MGRMRPQRWGNVVPPWTRTGTPADRRPEVVGFRPEAVGFRPEVVGLRPPRALVRSLVLLLAGLLVAAPVLPTGVPRADSAPGGAEVFRAAATLLEARAAALRRQDRAAWLAGVDRRGGGYLLQQEELFDSLRQLPLEHWSETVDPGRAGPVPASSRTLGSSAWTVPVVVRYRLAGFDGGDVVRHRDLTVRRWESAWLLTASPTDTGTGTTTGTGMGQRHERDLWELGPVHVLSGRASVVVGRRSRSELREYAERADAAAEAVREVWPGGESSRLVVVVPHDEEEMAAVLGGAGIAGLAAVTTGGLAGEARSDRVVANPHAFAALTPAGRQVVLTHEAVHVATGGAGRAGVPLWLSEGFAEHVAHEAGGTSVTSGAAPLLARVRGGDGPSRLPARGDFDPGTATADSAYTGAWLACRLIAQRHGDDALVSLYRAVADQGREGRSEQDALEAALGAELGTTSARLTADWRHYLRKLSG